MITILPISHNRTHFLKETKLVREFWINFRVWLITTGRHIEVMNAELFATRFDHCT